MSHQHTAHAHKTATENVGRGNLHGQHHHGHHHHHHAVEKVGKVLVWGIALNLAYVVVEGVLGIACGSMGLVSDAGHNLSDVFSLVLTLVGLRLALARSNSRFTYGYQKATILISLLNAVILLVAVGVIAVESIRKFSHPEPIDGDVVSWTAAVGIVVNGVTAWLLMKDQKEDLNIRGAFLHMAADTLVSLGVVVAGLFITFTGWVVVDPVISLVIAVLILISTWGMLRETLRLSIDGVPEGIDIDRLSERIRALPEVVSIHHLHVWALSTSANAMTLHVVAKGTDFEEVRSAVKAVAAEEGISHPTVEVETTPCSGEGLFEK